MIRYDLLHLATEYYKSHGFTYVETPWTVTPQTSALTRPPNGTDWTIEEKQKVLVASGEQSFLYQYLKGFLPKGKFQTITPCFRDDAFDLTHTKYFMKNELIITDAVNFEALNQLISDSMMLMRNLLSSEVTLTKVDENQYDIYWRDVELGSYGIRATTHLRWIYGTGVAEPRFSNAMRRRALEFGTNTNIEESIAEKIDQLTGRDTDGLPH